MTGAEYIVEFLYRHHIKRVFLLTGGSCAFLVDAIARHPEMDYVCFQHEQAAAMAADSVWRVNRTVGVSVVTSGPGATNLLTGIACSYFDSIPSIHITGQVNTSETAAFLGTEVRQAGFQETNIVDMAKPITKYALRVSSVEELKMGLARAYRIATSGRRGPVLIDVPMNVQKEYAGEEYTEPIEEAEEAVDEKLIINSRQRLSKLLHSSERPLVLLGAGVGLAGIEAKALQWLEKKRIPFVSSWNALTYFNHNSPEYYGHIGVYGNRGANYILQNCDALLVLGSRLDNRQRSGNTSLFAPKARILVVDIDFEELKKYSSDNYETIHLDLKHFPRVIEGLNAPQIDGSWLNFMQRMKGKYFGKDMSTFAQNHDSISPYAVTQRINALVDANAVIVSETGANLCWVYQIFHRTEQILFTSGGMSPMGYALPASIGAKLTAPNRAVICLLGDGGFQVNIQELQTIKHYNLDIKIVIFNNYGYGIIKQFQDAYLDGRYEASGKGYSAPDFKAVVKAYGLSYEKVNHLDQLTSALLNQRGACVFDVTLHENTQIEPKLEIGHPINDQFPYVNEEEFMEGNKFVLLQRAGKSL